eukprot:CAMPEP_0198257236 /NCGR_PEP_ID=MMETSP1447-20131203/6962_1 /TAXON_ID=420782 /ORGANISM="Chaetoceros dichaeta, Strain CCMP1751" /LENGTH=200 /DNA_ID=CAMNT_0043944081 /DNA_START=103 /DNA_END=705 /DNA_ORIENTATION=+
MKLPSLSPLLLTTTATILLSPTFTDAFAVSSLSSSVPSSSTKIAATTSDNEDEITSRRNVIAVTAGTFFAGMSLAAQAALATPNTLPTLSTELPPTTASSLLLSGTDNIFELPSYSEATKNRAIEVDLDTVNKAVVDKERKQRFNTNIDVESKTRSNAVRKDEIKEEDRMEKMMRLADEERKERLAKDKAESKATRWSTF